MGYILSAYRLALTPQQVLALRRLKERWLRSTPAGNFTTGPYTLCGPKSEHAGMIGVWVGEPSYNPYLKREAPGSTYIGIEPDGYTHS